MSDYECTHCGRAPVLEDRIAELEERIAELEALVSAYGEREESIVASYSELIHKIDRLREGDGLSYVTILTGSHGYVTVDVSRQPPYPREQADHE